MTTPDIQSLVESVLRKRAGEHTMSVLPSNLPLVSCRRLFVGSLYVAQVDNSDASESDLQADADAIALCWNAAPILARACNEKDAELTRLQAELAEAKGEIAVLQRNLAGAVDNEQERWQDALDNLFAQLVPDADIDGGGCDSGDPLDFSISEISQAIQYVERKAEAELAEEKRKVEGKEQVIRAQNIAMHEDTVKILNLESRIAALTTPSEKGETK